VDGSLSKPGPSKAGPSKPGPSLSGRKWIIDYVRLNVLITIAVSFLFDLLGLTDY